MNWNEYRKILVNAVMSGVFISIAGTAFLSVKNPWFGSFLFGLGLLTILCFNFKLYTGAIGYLAAKKKADFCPYLPVLGVIWTGNLLGCLICGNLLRMTRFSEPIYERALLLSEAKVGDGAISILILAFFCGLLMYTAVEVFAQKQIDGFVRGCIVFLCVMVFILCGFEHCVANMYYFSLANAWSVQTIVWLLLMTLGNSLGGMLIPLSDRFRK